MFGSECKSIIEVSSLLLFSLPFWILPPINSLAFFLLYYLSKRLEKVARLRILCVGLFFVCLCPFAIGLYKYIDSNDLTESSKYKHLCEKLENAQGDFVTTWDSVNWYCDYLTEYPNGSHCDEVTSLLSQIMTTKIKEEEANCSRFINTNDSIHMNFSLNSIDTCNNWTCPLVYLTYKVTEKYPNLEICPNMNDELFESCKRLNRIYVWNNYLTWISPQNSHYKDALNLKKQLELEKQQILNKKWDNEEDAYKMIKRCYSLSGFNAFIEQYPNSPYSAELKNLRKRIVRSIKPVIVDNDSVGFIRENYSEQELCEVEIHNAEYGNLKVLFNGPVAYYVNYNAFETKKVILPVGSYDVEYQVIYVDLNGKETNRSKLLTEKSSFKHDSYSYTIGGKYRMMIEEGKQVKKAMFGIDE